MPTERPTRVLLLRHAETAAPHLFHGAESDIGLSERGRKDALALAPRLAAERPVAVVSSPMRRAVETATPIADACGLPLTIEPQFHERRIGSLCGLVYDAERGPWAETLRRWRNGETGYTTDGAESFDEVRERVLPVWERLAERFEGERFIVVAHGAVIRVLLLTLDLGSDLRGDFAYPNLFIISLVRQDGAWLVAENPNSTSLSSRSQASDSQVLLARMQHQRQQDQATP